MEHPPVARYLPRPPLRGLRLVPGGLGDPTASGLDPRSAPGPHSGPGHGAQRLGQVRGSRQLRASLTAAPARRRDGDACGFLSGGGCVVCGVWCLLPFPGPPPGLCRHPRTHRSVPPPGVRGLGERACRCVCVRVIYCLRLPSKSCWHIHFQVQIAVVLHIPLSPICRQRPEIRP